MRRGSTGDTATIDEIIDMVLEQQESESTIGNFDEVREEISDVSSNLYHVNNSINRLVERKDRDRIVEYLYLGIASGLTVGIFQALGFDWLIATYGIILVSFWLAIFSSVLKIIRFGWIRSLIVNIVISFAFIVLSNLIDPKALPVITAINAPIFVIPIFSGIKGMLVGQSSLGLGEVNMKWIKEIHEEHAERLTPSLLAKAFRGELVSQEQG